MFHTSIVYNANTFKLVQKGITAETVLSPVLLIVRRVETRTDFVHVRQDGRGAIVQRVYI